MNRDVPVQKIFFHLKFNIKQITTECMHFAIKMFITVVIILEIKKKNTVQEEIVKL